MSPRRPTAEWADPSLDALDMCAVAAALVDEDGTVVAANSAFLDLVGEPREVVEAGLLRWSMFVSEGGARQDRHAWERLAEAGRSDPYEIHIERARDGRVRAIVRLVAPPQGPAGAAIVTVVDLSAVEVSEEEAWRERAEIFLRSVVDNTIDGIVNVDERGIVQSYNRAAERIFGYPAAEVIGYDVSLLLPDHARGGPDASVDGETGLARFVGTTREVEGRRRDGSTFPMDLAVSEFRLGSARYYTGIARDVSERRRAEAELRRAVAELERSNLDLEQFAYVASHDLQEPLRAVAGCVQILKRRYASALDERADELIAHTVDGVARMQALINDLLAYSRVGTRGADFAPTDTNEALRTALANLDAAIRESFAVVTSDYLPFVHGDAGQLALLFQNLVGNAIKFRSERAPVIHVGVRPGDGVWRFAVSDNGIGVEPTYFERVFVIFQRLHTRVEYDGTGIGLAVCKKIVDRHGGQIWLESEPGAGSTFYFVLPSGESERR